MTAFCSDGRMLRKARHPLASIYLTYKTYGTTGICGQLHCGRTLKLMVVVGP